MPGKFAAGALLVGLSGAALVVWFRFFAPASEVIVDEKPPAPMESPPQPAPARPDTAAANDIQPERPSLGERATIAFTTCTIPVAPGADPDGNIASRAELLTQKTAIVEYNATLNRYIECLDDKHERLKSEFKGIASAAELDELDALKADLHDIALNQVIARVEKFNQQLRAYKAAHSK